MRRWFAAGALGLAVVACTARTATAPRVAGPPAPLPARAPPPKPPAAPARTAATAAPTAAPTQEGLTAWKRNHEGLGANPPVKECLGCHEGSTVSVHRSHPVDEDYASAAGLAGSSLREPAEAQRRGARLPDGKVHCLSCHDPGSPWQSHVALPAGARVRPALVLGPDDGSGEAPSAAQAPAPPAGSAVNTMPLCQTCHTYGD